MNRMLKSLLSCSCGDKWSDVGTLVLRVAVGAIFLQHGYTKVFDTGIEGIAGFLGTLGFPAATFFAYVLSYGEIAVGALLILGLLTHWAAKFGVIVAAVAFFLVHLENGFSAAQGGYEFVMLIFAATLAIMISGPGRYSLDAKMRGNGAM
jgi:putative oxidoreductase